MRNHVECWPICSLDIDKCQHAWALIVSYLPNREAYEAETTITHFTVIFKTPCNFLMTKILVSFYLNIHFHNLRVEYAI